MIERKHHDDAGTEAEVRAGFRYALMPTKKEWGLRLEDYWVWCGSAIRGEDGLYHLFASRWPRGLVFHPHWLTNSEIIRAVSASPEGPYTFAGTVLPPRGGQYWDGLMTHNPAIRRLGDRYLLFYTGSRYDGAMPEPGRPEEERSPLVAQAHANQRIGVAIAPSPAGPWTRFDRPILEPRPGRWDSLMTTNPAPCVLADGRILLIYKAVSKYGDLLRFGVAMTEQPDEPAGPYRRMTDTPILTSDSTGDHLEDPYVWCNASGSFEMIAKDMAGGYCGEPRGGMHASSGNGVDWTLSNPPLAYRREILWEDGTKTFPSMMERPQLFIANGENGIPTHALFAVGESSGEQGSHAALESSYCQVIPLRPCPERTA